ncbi:hypothetical protein [Streptomyces sp. AC555_RSS877]|nr:hypothetical protein [Streptomyces sp. AC555_RSS877]
MTAGRRAQFSAQQRERLTALGVKATERPVPAPAAKGAGTA